jgi:hypothetical protein
MKTKGGLSGSGPLTSDGSRGSQAGRLDCVSSGQKDLKEIPKLKGGTRLESTKVRWCLWLSGREAALQEQWPKTLKKICKNDFR